MTRKIAVFTGTRAEYGLLYWLMKGIDADPTLTLQTLVSGMHLSPEFGNTWEQIAADGFRIDERVEMLLSSDSPVGIAKSMGLGLIGFADALDRLQPDLLVVLGDRFEALAVCQAALALRIPIAHLHGGELTEGLIDDAVRHSITKMSHLHFASTEAYRQRIIRLGEAPDRVWNVGAVGLENVRRLRPLDMSALADRVQAPLSQPFLLATYHPVTLSADGAIEALRNLLRVFDEFPDHAVLMTFPNADTHGRALIQVLDEYAARHPDRFFLRRSLGQLGYLSAMHHCSCVIGNSSSGLIEAPAVHVPTVDIGDRQKGRIRPATVIHCDESYEGILTAVRQALSSAFQAHCKTASNPYGDGDVAGRIVATLRDVNLDGLIGKAFFDGASA